MGDREDKVSKAREKLERFRKKKQQQSGDPGAETVLEQPVEKSVAAPSEPLPPVTLAECQQTESDAQQQHEGPGSDDIPVENATSGLAAYFAGSTAEDADAGVSFSNLVDERETCAAREASSNSTPSALLQIEVEQRPEQTELQFGGDRSAFSKLESNLPSLGSPILPASAKPENVNKFTHDEDRDEKDINLAQKEIASALSSLRPSAGLTELQQQVECLKKDLEEDRRIKEDLEKELQTVRAEKEVYQVKLQQESKLQAELDAKAATISLLVSEKAELEKSNKQLAAQTSSLQEDKASLETSVEQLGAACAELRLQIQSSADNTEQIETLRRNSENEIQFLKETLLEKEHSFREIQSKLGKVCSENDSLTSQVAGLGSELEMARVHLAQLRGSGAGQQLLQEKDAELVQQGRELATARAGLQEALARVEQLAGERDQLAEQYRSYSRDLASQAERLAEQLTKFQQENAVLVTREAGLVQHVAGLESQLQQFLQTGGAAGAEQELARLKAKLERAEQERGQMREERGQMEEMLGERSIQVDEMTGRLAARDSRCLELQSALSSLQTQLEMVQSTSASSSNQAELLAACQSDKVAASRAIQQNVSLKERLEELQGALVSLTNSKAELVDQLESANRKIDSFANMEAEIAGREEAVKERDILLTNTRNQVRYLEAELAGRRSPDMEEVTQVKMEEVVTVENTEKSVALEGELLQAKEIIRSLNSQNSELRSKLEVLASNTRECSESPNSSSSDERVEMAESTLSDDTSSSESFIEINKKTSSDSFVEIDNEGERVESINSVEEAILHTEDLPFVPQQKYFLSSDEVSTSFQQLEHRFMLAMEQLAELSSDKEQLEHLVERLQDETETIGDYVIMYQHQRKLHRTKIQEKEEQVQQLAKDRAELLGKLQQLQAMVTNLVEPGVSSVAVESAAEALTATTASAAETVAVSETVQSSLEREKILELIADIGTGSGQMVAACQQFQPWFWETSPSKVLTV